MGLDALVVIGGDGTLTHRARASTSAASPSSACPKTIDNDIAETTMTFGFDTAVAFATDAIDRLHTTAEAHHRVMVVEVMGRYAGWIALYAGIGGGADVVLIPEIPFDVDEGRRCDIMERERWRRALQHRRRGRGRAPGWRRAQRSSSKPERADKLERLGGMARARRPRPREADRQGIAPRRARPPAARRRRRRATTACWRPVRQLRRRADPAPRVRRDGRRCGRPTSSSVSLECIVGQTRNVPVNGDVVRTARNVGICFGD